MRRLPVLLILIASPAAFTAPEWWHVASDHFEVYSADDRSNLAETVRRFERVYTVLAREFALPPTRSDRTRLIIFPGVKEMAPYRPRPESIAFWFDSPNGDFMGMPPLTTETWAEAAHEITHLVVGRTGAFYPVWLNEGLALYYSTLAFTRDRVRIGGPPVYAVKTLTTTGFTIPLEQLFRPWTELAPATDSRTASIFYAESWALTHLIFQDDRYRDKAKVFLGAVAGGAPTPDALLKTFGRSVDDILGDAKAHLAKLRLPSSLLPAPPPDTRPVMPAEAADAVEIDRTLAELLGWQHDTARVDLGRAALAALRARAPDDLRLLESRGLISYHTGHCAEAIEDLKRAVDLNSQNAAVLRAYARLLGASDAEFQRSLFARAAELSPVRPRPSVVVLPCGG